MIVCAQHQRLAEDLADGTTIGANLAAEILALLDALGHASGNESEALIRTGTGLSDRLLGRHSQRSIRRVFRLLMDEGLLARSWPMEERYPVYLLDTVLLRQRLAGEKGNGINPEQGAGVTLSSLSTTNN